MLREDIADSAAHDGSTMAGGHALRRRAGSAALAAAGANTSTSGAEEASEAESLLDSGDSEHSDSDRSSPPRRAQRRGAAWAKRPRSKSPAVAPPAPPPPARLSKQRSKSARQPRAAHVSPAADSDSDASSLRAAVATRDSSLSAHRRPRVAITQFDETVSAALASAVAELGGVLVQAVEGAPGSQAPTHVVCGVGKGEHCRRTLKYLFGVANGCWLVCAEWLEASQRRGAWVNEAPFEIPGDSTSLGKGGPRRSRTSMAAGVRRRRSSARARLFSDLRVAAQLLRLFHDVKFYFPRGAATSRGPLDSNTLRELLGLFGGSTISRLPDGVQECRQDARGFALLEGGSALLAVAPDEPDGQPPSPSRVESLQRRLGVPVFTRQWLLACMARYEVLPKE